MKKITLQRLYQVLDYNENTGEFRWIVDTRNTAIGQVAGSPDKDGYVLIRIDGVHHRRGRLAWFYCHGVWPEYEIDHADLDKKNDRLANLRLATRGQNSANTNPYNKTGLKGVSYDARKQKFEAKIYKDKKKFWLGYFDTAEAANAAYKSKADELFGEFARSS